MSNITVSKTVSIVSLFALAVFAFPFSAYADGYEVNYGYDWGSNDYGYYTDTYDWGYSDYDYYNDSYDWGYTDYDYYGGYNTGTWNGGYDWGSNDYDYYSGYNTGVWVGDYNTGTWTGDYNTGTWTGGYSDFTYTDYPYTDYSYVDYPYYDYSYSEPYYSTPIYGGSYDPYYVDYSFSYNDYWYTPPTYSNPPRYNPPTYNPPRHDSPTCVIRVSDKTPDEGDYVTVSWDADDADEATLTGFGDVNPRSGSERIRVHNDRTFTLRVEGPGGSGTCSISVRVDEEEEDDDLWCELDASRTRIEEGDSTTLEWDTRGDVRRASINQGIGSVDEDGGTERVRPNRTTTYRLTIEDRDGDEEDCSVTVRVDEDDSLPPPPDVPLVYLSQLPYTGAEDGPMYWILLIVGSGLAGYFTLFRAVPFAYARVKMLRSDTDTEETPVGEGEVAPQNVTRQDVRAFVSAIAEGDTASAREFALTGGEVLFSEAAVILDDVARSRENGTPADPMVKDITKTWDASKFSALIDAFANAKDETVVEKVIG